MIAQKLAQTPAVHSSRAPTQPTPVDTGRLKRACDLGFGVLLLLSTLPVIAVAWTLVRLTSAGPGFYSQVRVGRGGRHYRIYKIRTMTHNCEAKFGAQWAKKKDVRITRVGRILRKLHIDELPQLWNVLRGDMSLVGPRPERPEFVRPLTAEIAGYSARHCVRPGVTGLAQIQLPSDSSVESVRTKLVLDLCYIQKVNVWLDLRILVGTVVYLIGLSYTSVRRVTRLPNPLADKPKVVKNADKAKPDDTQVHRPLGPPASPDDTTTHPRLSVDVRPTLRGEA